MLQTCRKAARYSGSRPHLHVLLRDRTMIIITINPGNRALAQGSTSYITRLTSHVQLVPIQQVSRFGIYAGFHVLCNAFSMSTTMSHHYTSAQQPVARPPHGRSDPPRRPKNRFDARSMFIQTQLRNAVNLRSVIAPGDYNSCVCAATPPKVQRQNPRPRILHCKSFCKSTSHNSVATSIKFAL